MKLSSSTRYVRTARLVFRLPTYARVVWGILRDFNGHDRWHPAVKASSIERHLPSDLVGCVRRFQLQDGSELREQLLALSDLEMTFSYCLLDTPIPLFNYVAHVRLLPVTDGQRTFLEWTAEFDCAPEREAELVSNIGTGVFQGGFDALKRQFGG